MSTVFYGIECPKDKFWFIYDDIRKWVLENHIILKAIREKKKEDPTIKEQLGMKDFDLFVEEIASELQLFEVEDKYIIRLLEKGYFIQNNLDKMSKELTKFEVDTRTDPPTDISYEEYEKRVEIVENVLSPMIDNKHTFIVPIVDKSDVIRTYLG